MIQATVQRPATYLLLSTDSNANRQDVRLYHNHFRFPPYCSFLVMDFMKIEVVNQ